MSDVFVRVVPRLPDARDALEGPPTLDELVWWRGERRAWLRRSLLWLGSLYCLPIAVGVGLRFVTGLPARSVGGVIASMFLMGGAWGLVSAIHNLAKQHDDVRAKSIRARRMRERLMVGPEGG